MLRTINTSYLGVLEEELKTYHNLLVESPGQPVHLSAIKRQCEDSSLVLADLTAEPLASGESLIRSGRKHCPKQGRVTLKVSKL